MRKPENLYFMFFKERMVDLKNTEAHLPQLPCRILTIVHPPP